VWSSSKDLRALDPFRLSINLRVVILAAGGHETKRKIDQATAAFMPGLDG
jgi:hypothetical protein